MKYTAHQFSNGTITKIVHTEGNFPMTLMKLVGIPAVHIITMVQGHCFPGLDKCNCGLRVTACCFLPFCYLTRVQWLFRLEKLGNKVGCQKDTRTDVNSQECTEFWVFQGLWQIAQNSRTWNLIHLVCKVLKQLDLLFCCNLLSFLLLHLELLLLL